MVSLHCTRELARALKLPASLSTARGAASSQLGPWSLGLANCRSAKLLVAVSTSTRWAFVYVAAPFASLQTRFEPALLQNLLALGVPPDRARREVDAHAPTHWAQGHDRGTLSHLNQCVADVLWAAQDGLSLPSLNQRLAGRIIIKPQSATPASEVLRLLGGDPDRLGRQARELGTHWQENWQFMQSQAGQATVTLSVARLLNLERLEAGHQASVLLGHLPMSVPPGASQAALPRRWVPHELVLDMQGIDAVGPQFARALANECAALGVARVVVANAAEGVFESLFIQ
jgi:hypothetical protein